MAGAGVRSRALAALVGDPAGRQKVREENLAQLRLEPVGGGEPAQPPCAHALEEHDGTRLCDNSPRHGREKRALRTARESERREGGTRGWRRQQQARELLFCYSERTSQGKAGREKGRGSRKESEPLCAHMALIWSRVYRSLCRSVISRCRGHQHSSAHGPPLNMSEVFEMHTCPPIQTIQSSAVQHSDLHPPPCPVSATDCTSGVSAPLPAPCCHAAPRHAVRPAATCPPACLGVAAGRAACSGEGGQVAAGRAAHSNRIHPNEPFLLWQTAKGSNASCVNDPRRAGPVRHHPVCPPLLSLGIQPTSSSSIRNSTRL